MARRTRQKIQFGKTVKINDEFRFVIERVYDEYGVLSKTEFSCTEYNYDGEITDSYIGTANEIEKFVHRDYEMIIELPIVGI